MLMCGPQPILIHIHVKLIYIETTAVCLQHFFLFCICKCSFLKPNMLFESECSNSFILGLRLSFSLSLSLSLSFFNTHKHTHTHYISSQGTIEVGDREPASGSLGSVLREIEVLALFVSNRAGKLLRLWT